MGSVVANNAGAHNSFYRGNDITNDFIDGTFSTNVNNGTCKNIFPGDYIQKDILINNTTTNVTFYVAHLKYYDTGVVMWPGTNLASAVMNNTAVTQNGYVGSRMYSTTLPTLLTAIRNAFGSTHIGAMTVYYPNSFEGNTGKATGWKDYSVYLTLPTECQVYGCPIWSDIGYEMGFESSQLALFRHNKKINNSDFWLRNVSKYNNYNSAFCYCLSLGRAYVGDASASHGVRPLFNLT